MTSDTNTTTRNLTATANVMAESSKARGIEALRRAVETVRQACEDAERTIGRAEQDGLDTRAVSGVMHALAWGQANATSSIESALAAVRDIHAAELLLGRKA